MSNLDKRLNAWRPDLANIALEGKVDATYFVESTLKQVIMPVLTLRRGASFSTAQDSELLLGDFVKVFEQSDGWAWVQNCRDNYVGYCPIEGLGGLGPAPTHQVSVLRTIVFPEPDLKACPLNYLSMTASVCVIEQNEKYSQLANGGWVYTEHLSLVDDVDDDYVDTAHKFMETPYLWGGNSSLGIDCSGLVQIALRRAGHIVLRDADMQESSIGKHIPFDGDKSSLKYGDLIFWKGHVGFYCEDDMLIHANATDMMVSKAPFDDICDHILEIENNPVSSVRRL